MGKKKVRYEVNPFNGELYEVIEPPKLSSDTYHEKEGYLAHTFERVEPMDFYRDLFPLGSFQHKPKPPEGKPNGMILRIEEGEGRHTLITDSLEQIADNLGKPDIIISPVGYYGWRPTLRNSSMMYAMTVDLDGVGEKQLISLFHQIKNDVTPKPTYITNSGNGCHLYYLLDNAEPMKRSRKPHLKQIRQALINEVWNGYTSTIPVKNRQYGSLIQGFRAPGTQSKLGAYTGEDLPVTVFKVGEKMSLDYLTSRVRLEGLDIGRPRSSYEKTGYHWKVNRALYDWWKVKIFHEAKAHHRYFCIMALAIYAKKCGIAEEELIKDAYGFIPHMNEIHNEPFTKADVKSALKAYKDESATYPRYFIEEKTAIPMPANKRNYRKQKDHVQLMNTMKALKKQLGEEVRDGRPSARQLVSSWQSEHPTATKAECHRATGLDPKTIRKWWKGAEE